MTIIHMRHTEYLHTPDKLCLCLNVQNNTIEFLNQGRTKNDFMTGQHLILSSSLM